MISRYDIRQINLMRSRIRQYKANEIKLGKLIDDLSALLNCLETVDQVWKESFMSVWGILEEMYAGALAEDRYYLHDVEIGYVNTAVNQLESFINKLDTADSGEEGECDQ